MRRPSFQFYAADWIGSANLRRCTHAEKGVWIDVMCLMHDSNEYGVLRWSLKEIAQAVGCKPRDLNALIDKGVLKGGDKHLPDAFIYTPRSGRVDGDPVTLIPSQPGPIWYSSRMVRDEYVRGKAGASTRFGATPPVENYGSDEKTATNRAKLRAKVLKKTSGNCYHCSAPLGGVWEIDHLIPKSNGGPDTYANMVPSCVACNQEKTDSLPDDFASLMSSPSHRRGANRSDGSTSSSSSTNKEHSAAVTPKQNVPDQSGKPEQHYDPTQKNPPSGKTPEAETAAHEDATVAAVSTRALDIAVLLKRRGVIIPPGDVRMRRWAQDGISDAVLLAALETAELRRVSRGCSNPVNAGLIDSILADAQAPPARASPRGAGKQAARDAYLDARAVAGKKHGFDEKGGGDGRHECDIRGEYSRVA